MTNETYLKVLKLQLNGTNKVITTRRPRTPYQRMVLRWQIIGALSAIALLALALW